MRNRLALVFVALLVAAGTAVGLVLATSGGGDPDGLPAVDGTDTPTAYRIVYEVITPEAQSTEERVVHRPFGARITTRDIEGDVTSARWSALGTLITQGAEGDPTSLATAVAPAASDLRPELFVERLVDADRLVPGPEVEVGGRRCRRYGEARAAATVPDEGAPTVGEASSVPLTVERCVDADGIVLEEKWTTPTNDRVLTKRAITLELDDDVRAVALPDAEPLPAERGNGSIREVDADQAPPADEAFTLGTPDGFRFLGRYEVELPQLGRTPQPDAAVTLVTDVWQRGADVLLLDQGTNPSGRPPFDAGTEVETLELEGIGAATLAMDLRSAEVRLSRPGGGFVRLAGTVPVDELLDLARTLTVAPSGR